MRKLTAILVASGLALGAANLAHAADTSAPAMDNGQQMMKHHRGHPGGPGDMMMFHGLNLTDAQKQQFRDIMKAQHENMKRPSVEERRAMHDIIASDTFDSAKAQAQIDKMSEQSKQRMLARMEARILAGMYPASEINTRHHREISDDFTLTGDRQCIFVI